MTNFFKVFLILTLFSSVLHAQMWNGVDTLYGNEWIDFDKKYFKFLTAEDGVYKIDYATLKDAGFPVDDVAADRFQLFSMGVEIPIRATASGIFGANDYLEFVGTQNKSELDDYLFENPQTDNLNPEFSLFTDSTAFFLTWSDNSSQVRFNEATNELGQVSSFSEELIYDTTIVFANSYRSPRNGRSALSPGEGFALPRGGAPQVINFELPYFVDDAENDVMNIRLSANVRDSHHIVINLNGEMVLDTNYTDDDILLATVHEFPIKIRAGLLTQNNTLEIVANKSSDLQFVSNLKIRYRRSINISNSDNFYFNHYISRNPVGLKFQLSANQLTNQLALYDLANHLFIIPKMENEEASLVLPPASSVGQFLFSTKPKEVLSLNEVIFRDFKNDDNNYVILTSYEAFDNPQIAEQNVSKYADYRSSPEGGNFRVGKYLIDELYDQFSYGINRHPISIRNFSHYINKEWDDLQYFLIIGKGREYHKKRTKGQIDTHLPFIPTFGVPGSDNLLVSTQGRPLPIASIGRIATIAATDIENYLEKVKMHEAFDTEINTIENREWTKRILHFGGGTSPLEQLSISNHLTDLEENISNNSFGGKIKSYYKDSTDPIESGQSDDIIRRIDEGVSLMTVFGHGSIGSFDFAIDLVNNFNNSPKFPFLISMGCYSGNIHDVNGTGYEYVFTPQKGSVGFIATSGQGAISPLYYQVDKIYDEFGSGKGVTIGSALRNSFEKIDSLRKDSLDIRLLGNSQIELIEQYTLLGDPATKVHSYQYPDYIVFPESIKLSSNIVNGDIDDLVLDFSILNTGKNLPDTSIIVEIYSKSPIGIEEVLFSDTVNMNGFEVPVKLQLPIEVTRENLGFNNLRIVIDADNQIEELPASAEQNNEYANADFGFYIVDNGIVPVSPTDCSIVNESLIELIGSATSSNQELKKVIYQIDKTNEFDSSDFVEQTIETIGGITVTNANIAPVNDEVYFWRTSLDSTNTGFGYNWQNSSFLYDLSLPNGFNQSHYQQFSQNRFSNLEIDTATKKLKFIDDIKEIRVKNFAYTSGRNVPAYFINNARTQKVITNVRGFYVAILDSISAEPWVNPPRGSMGASGFSFPMNAFPFATQVISQRRNLINFLKDSIPDNSYVLMFTVQTPTAGYFPDKWLSDSTSLGTTIFDVLEDNGATKIRDLESTGSLPYVFFFQKGGNVLGEFLADSVSQVIDETFPITGNWTEGFMTSKLIGPSKNWDSLVWMATPSMPNTDEFYLNVIGRKVDGVDSLIFEDITSSDVSLSTIEAAQFPYLSLEFHATDRTNRTAPNLDYWRVFYESYPEVAINAEKKYVESKDSLSQGEIYSLELGYENLSQYDMDSLLVYYSIRDGQTLVLENYERVADLKKRASSSYVIEIDTKNLQGAQRLFFEINPNKDQPELHEFNNFFQEEFFVRTDKRNPLLNVTFDGIRIMDGEIVSAAPIIVANLKDENLLFPISDSASFEVYLKMPNAVDFVLLPIASPEIDFIPANSTNSNIAKIEYKPTFTADGEYALKIKAKDAAGNLAGKFDYVVKFNVITKSTISNLLTYPNPFSTATSFVYTLTGSKSPSNFKIQIMSISGKIVREITNAEIGPLRIGTHKTNYQWDGTDEFGDKLANGVYLYRFVVQDNSGEMIEQRATTMDQYFKNDIGKLVILR